MHPLLALGLAYLAGSFPSAYLAGRAIKGVDLRTMGSGNLGATNVYRNLGAPAALAVLVLDALKGALPVALLPGLLAARYVPGATAELGWALAFGGAAILGHAKPIFLLWRGGTAARARVDRGAAVAGVPRGLRDLDLRHLVAPQEHRPAAAGHRAAHVQHGRKDGRVNMNRQANHVNPGGAS